MCLEKWLVKMKVFFFFFFLTFGGEYEETVRDALKVGIFNTIHKYDMIKFKWVRIIVGRPALAWLISCWFRVDLLNLNDFVHYSFQDELIHEPL